MNTESKDYTGDEVSLGKGWEAAGEALANAGTGSFLKVEPGASVLLNVVGEPEVYQKIFAPGDDAKTRWKVDVFVLEEGVLKTWDMAKTVFEQLKRQRTRRGDNFGTAVLELGRKGSGLDTRWWLEFARDLTAAEEEAVAAALPHRGEIPF